MTCRRRISWFISVLILAIVTGCSEPLDPPAVIAKAQEAQARGDLPEAIIGLRNLVQRHPDNAEAHYLLGTAYLESGSAQFATTEFGDALARGYDAKRVLPELAKSLVAQSKFQEALEATDPARVPGAQGSPEVLNVRAYAQLGLRKLAAAKSSLDLAMRLRPDFADGMLTRARIAMMERDPDAALAQVEIALTVAPKNVDGWLLKGDLQRQAGDLDLARTAYRQAIAIDPRSIAAHVGLATLEISTKNFRDAEPVIAALRAIAPKNVAGIYMTGLIELRSGNGAGALASASRAIELSPEHVPSLVLAARAELALQHSNQANGYLTRAVKVDPRNTAARKLLAALQMQSGNPAETLATLEPILDAPGAAADPELLALAGDAYMATRQFAKATLSFEKATALDPRNAATRVGLGVSRMATGATDSAIADLEAAAELGKGGTRADVMLAMLKLRTRRYDEALRAIGKLEKAQSDNTLVYNLKAAAYMGKGDAPRARVELERALKIDPAYFPAAANLAKLDLYAGKPDAARQRYESVLAKEPKHMQAMLALANLSSRTAGKEKEALDWIERAEKAHPGDSAPIRAKITYYRRSAQLEKALALAVAQRKARPDDPDLLEVVGELLLALGNAPAAVNAFAERIVLLPNSPDAFLALAGAQVAAKDPVAAAASLRSALRLRPRYPRAQAALVAAELAQDHTDRAWDIATEVRRQLPQAPLGYVLEGDVLAASGKTAQAAVLYEKGYALHKSAQVALKIYGLWAEAGQPERGEVQVRQWLAQYPQDIVTRRQYAYSSIQRGRYAVGVEQYRKLIEQQPNDPVALNNLAWALYRMKDPEALRHAQRAYELRPGDSSIADTLAEILVEKGELPRAIEILRKAMSATPADLNIRLHLAQALAKSGETLLAIKQLDVVIAAGAQFPRAADAVALRKELRP